MLSQAMVKVFETCEGRTHFATLFEKKVVNVNVFLDIFMKIAYNIASKQASKQA
ncbi:MAG: hypothetical protein LBU43_09250 [Candidatus Accumulibacter sp.]|nr:hypothetical protein [Accumulibacter sp.]